MASITVHRRHTLYLFLGLITFVVGVLHGVAGSLPLWSVDLPREYGMWSTCSRSAGWLVRQCLELKHVSICNGWFQSVRVHWAIATTCMVLAIFLCLVSALQTNPTNLAPSLIVILNFIAFVCTLMTWVSWYVYRGEDCNGWDGMRLGSSFICEVICWVLYFIPLLFSFYLRTAKIFVPTAEKSDIYEASSNYQLPTPSSPAYYP